MESIFEGLTNRVLGSAGLLYLDKNCWLRGRMAYGEVNAAFSGLVFWLDNGGVPCIPSQLLEETQNDALRDGLLVGESPLTQSFCNVGKGRFESH